MLEQQLLVFVKRLNAEQQVLVLILVLLVLLVLGKLPEWELLSGEVVVDGEEKVWI